MTSTKKRGRKPISEGGASAPRKIFCVCSSVINGKLVSEEIHCEASGKDSSNSDIIKEATGKFTTTHGSGPDSVLGPYYERVRGKTKSVDKTLSGLSIETTDFVPDTLGQAVYNGWNVSVRLIEQNTDAAFILYKTHIHNDKKNKPKNKFVMKSSLEELSFD
jgi:hypothetical protein